MAPALTAGCPLQGDVGSGVDLGAWNTRVGLGLTPKPWEPGAAPTVHLGPWLGTWARATPLRALLLGQLSLPRPLCPSESCCPQTSAPLVHAGCPVYQAQGQAWIGSSSACLAHPATLSLGSSLIKGISVCPAWCSGTLPGPCPCFPELGAFYKPQPVPWSPCLLICFSLPNRGLMKDRDTIECPCPAVPTWVWPRRGTTPCRASQELPET